MVLFIQEASQQPGRRSMVGSRAQNLAERLEQAVGYLNWDGIQSFKTGGFTARLHSSPPTDRQTAWYAIVFGSMILYK